jgi:CDP-diacylglycerol--glycerol-3-phosphate 3-phosphatidyltransferase
MTERLVTIPNVLSGLRLSSVPVLLVLARQGYADAFLLLLIFALLTDIADGYLARRLRQESEFGARLDSWGDFSIYLSTPLCAWWLSPEIVRREAPLVIAVLAAFLLPILIGFAKYRRLTCYHTWGAKLSAVLMSVGTVLLFAGGPPWLFRFSTIVLVLTQIEEIAITIVSPEWRSNVPTILHALRRTREERAKGRGNSGVKAEDLRLKDIEL